MSECEPSSYHEEGETVTGGAWPGPSTQAMSEGTSPVRRTRAKDNLTSDVTITPDRVTNRAEEAVPILTGKGGNPAMLLTTRLVTITNYPPPPLSPLIQITGAADGETTLRRW